MGTKFGLILGAGVGYVFGTRAGRERYEKIKSGASKLRQSPVVAKPMDSASDKIAEAMRRGGEAATDKVVGIVKERVFGQTPNKRAEYVDVDVIEIHEDAPATNATQAGEKPSR